MEKIEAITPAAPMENEPLYDEAVSLACEMFDEPTDDHILALYERLLWNERHGLGLDGAATIH